MNNYIYIAVMALVSYTIRILPLTLADPQPVHPVVFVLRALRDAGGHDLPGHHPRHPDADLRRSGPGGGHCGRLAGSRAVSGFGSLLRFGVCD